MSALWFAKVEKRVRQPLPIVLALTDENDGARMQMRLSNAGYDATCVAQDRLSHKSLPGPVLIIADTTYEGTPIVDSITDLLDLEDDLRVIFLLAKKPEVPSWGFPFLDKEVGFFASEYADQEFVSYVIAFMSRFG